MSGRLCVLALAIGALPLACALRFNQMQEPAPDTHMPEMDIIMLSAKIDCISKFSIQRLQEYVKHKKIHFITKGEVCEKQGDELPDGVECIDEDKAVEGFSFKEIKNAFTKMDRYYKSQLTSRTGWFLQQFLKLAYPLSRDDISQDYLVFDADMFPTKNLTLYKDFLPVLKSGGHRGKWNTEYEEAYKYLSGGLDMQYPNSVQDDDKSTYVVHHMLFRKPWVTEMLNQFGAVAPWDPLQVSQMVFQMWAMPKWAQAAMTHAAFNNLTSGFSEYAMYASWVHTYHSGEISYLLNQSGPTRHKRVPFCNGLGLEADCCPADEMFATDADCYGSEISGMEGHVNHDTSKDATKPMDLHAKKDLYRDVTQCEKPAGSLIQQDPEEMSLLQEAALLHQIAAGYPAEHSVMENWYKSINEWEKTNKNFAVHAPKKTVVVWGILIPEGYEMIGSANTQASDKWVRDVHRKTWMSQPGLCGPGRANEPKETTKCLGYKAFVVGNHKLDKEARFKTSLDQALTYPESLQAEATENKDILYLWGEPENMREGKTFEWFRFAAQNFPHATHIAKVDSDAYPVLHMIYPKIPALPASVTVSSSSLLERPGSKGTGYQKPEPQEHIRKEWECHSSSPYQFLGNNKAKLVHGGSLYMMSVPLAEKVTEDNSYWSSHRANTYLGEDKTTSIGVIEFHNEQCVDDINLDGTYLHGAGCWPNMADFHEHCLEYSINLREHKPFSAVSRKIAVGRSTAEFEKNEVKHAATAAALVFRAVDSPAIRSQLGLMKEELNDDLQTE